MRIFAFFCVILILLSGCSKKDDDLSSAAKNVVSEEKRIDFRELLLFVNLKAADGSYLVVKSVDSIAVYINNFHWATISSEPVDTTKIDKSVSGNRLLTSHKINYFSLATRHAEEQPDYTTAGDFAQYLHSLLSLENGEYVCFIESFTVNI